MAHRRRVSGSIGKHRESVYVLIVQGTYRLSGLSTIESEFPRLPAECRSNVLVVNCKKVSNITVV